MTLHTAQLRGLVDVVMGQAPPGSDCNTRGDGTVFVKAGEFKGRFPIVREWTTNPQKLARRGDVLVCVVGATAGKVCQAIDCAIGRSVAAVRPKPDRLDAGFLFHFLSTQTPRLRKKSQGLAQGVITREMLEEIATPLPPIDEQRRIAVILDHAEELLRKRRQSLALLADLIKAVFMEMFGSLKTVNRVSRLGDLIKVRSGEPLVIRDHDRDGKFPVYGGNGVNGYHGKYLVEKNTIVIGRVGVYCGSVHVTKSPAWVTDNALIVDIKSSELETEYLATALTYANINKYANQSAQPLVSGGRIYPIEIPMPSVSLQNAFAERAREIDKVQLACRAHLAELNALFASLQHHAFRRELTAERATATLEMAG